MPSSTDAESELDRKLEELGIQNSLSDREKLFALWKIFLDNQTNLNATALSIEKLRTQHADEIKEVELYVEHIRKLSNERESLTQELEVENEALKLEGERLRSELNSSNSKKAISEMLAQQELDEIVDSPILEQIAYLLVERARLLDEIDSIRQNVDESAAAAEGDGRNDGTAGRVNGNLPSEKFGPKFGPKAVEQIRKQYEIELNSIKQEKENLSVLLRSAQTQISQLQTKLKSSDALMEGSVQEETEEQSLKVKLVVRERQVEDLRDRVAALEAENAKLAQGSKVDSDYQMISVPSSQDDATAAGSADGNSADGKNESASSKAAKLEESLQQRDTTIEQLKGQIERLREGNETLSSELAVLRERNRNADDLIVRTQRELALKLSSPTAELCQADGSSVDRSQHDKVIASYEQKIVELRKDNELLMKERETLSKQLTMISQSQDTRINDLQESLTVVTKDRDRLEQNVRKLELNREHERQRLDAKVSDIRQLESRLTTLRQDNLALQDKLTDAFKQETVNAVERAEQRSLSSPPIPTETPDASSLERVRELQEANRLLEQRITEVSQEFNDSRKEMANVRTERDNLLQERLNWQNEMNALKKEIAQLPTDNLKTTDDRSRASPLENGVDFEPTMEPAKESIEESGGESTNDSRASNLARQLTVVEAELAVANDELARLRRVNTDAIEQASRDAESLAQARRQVASLRESEQQLRQLNTNLQHQLLESEAKLNQVKTHSQSIAEMRDATETDKTQLEVQLRRQSELQQVLVLELQAAKQRCEVLSKQQETRRARIKEKLRYARTCYGRERGHLMNELQSANQELEQAKQALVDERQWRERLEKELSRAQQTNGRLQAQLEDFRNEGSEKSRLAAVAGMRVELLEQECRHLRQVVRNLTGPSGNASPLGHSKLSPNGTQNSAWESRANRSMTSTTACLLVDDHHHQLTETSSRDQLLLVEASSSGVVNGTVDEPSPSLNHLQVKTG